MQSCMHLNKIKTWSINDPSPQEIIMLKYKLQRHIPLDLNLATDF